MGLVPRRKIFHRYVHAVILSGLAFLLNVLIQSSAQAAGTGIKEYFIHDSVFDARVRMLETGDVSRPLLVLVHGLNSSANVWQAFMPDLAQHFHVLAFDLPGFGQSSKANKLYSPDNYVAFIHSALGRFADKQIILVGHSMGGNIALRYAMTYPQLVNRLILVDAAGILHRLVYTEFLTHFGIRLLPQFYPQQKQDMKSFTDDLFGILSEYSPVMDIGEKYILSQPDLRERFFGGNPSVISAYAMMLTNYTGILRQFNVPTLLLWGGQDFVAPLRIAHILAANLDDAGLVVLPDAGHSPLHDTPQALMDWLSRFALASPKEAQAILAQHRYIIPSEIASTSTRVGRCIKQDGLTFRGDYAKLFIEDCHNVQLQQLRAKQLVIKHSTVKMDQCLIQSSKLALRISDSSIAMTACRVSGTPAIMTSGSKLDIAGSHIQSKGSTFVAVTQGTESTLLFSVTELRTGQHGQYEHGSVILRPGESL